MASMEQLHMLNDDDSSTSSSEDENMVMNELTTSNDDGSNDDGSNNDGSNDEVRSQPDASPSATIDTNHHKKRIKLSLGGKFKAVISSPKQEPPRQSAKKVKDNPPKTSAAALAIAATATAQAQATAQARTAAATAATAATVQAQTTTAAAAAAAAIIAAAGGTVSSFPEQKVVKSPTKTSSIKKSNSPTNNPVTNTPKVKITTKPTKNTSKDKAALASGKKMKPKEIKKRPTLKLPTSSSKPKTTPVESVPTPSKRTFTTTSSLRSIRITPMASPGLLLQLREGRTASDVFNQTMATAGYTIEARTKNPHRGSSIQRTVDDLFDSNVKFSDHFPNLVPDDLVSNDAQFIRTISKQAMSEFPTTVSQSPSPTTPNLPSSDPSITTAVNAGAGNSKPNSSLTEDRTVVLMNRLKKAFRPKTNPETTVSVVSTNETSRQQTNRIPQYSDMIPVSLSLPYPEKYIEKRLEYAKKVEEREKAIVDLQEKYLNDFLTHPDADLTENAGDIPPIPIHPDVPTRDDLRSITKGEEEIFGTEEQQEQSHPLYLPKNKDFVKHLDKNCFRAFDGRYFGLSSNAIADPYFYGPNAPGIVGGLTFSTSTGLATASAGGAGGSLGSLLFTMPAPLTSSSSSSSATTSKVVSTPLPKKRMIAPVSTDVAKAQPTPAPKDVATNPPIPAPKELTTTQLVVKPVVAPVNDSLSDGRGVDKK